MFAVPPTLRGEKFVSILGWWNRHDATCLLYIPTQPVFSYSTGICKNYCDDEARIQIITRTVNAFLTMACIFAAYRIGN